MDNNVMDWQKTLADKFKPQLEAIEKNIECMMLTDAIQPAPDSISYNLSFIDTAFNMAEHEMLKDSGLHLYNIDDNQYYQDGNLIRRLKTAIFEDNGLHFYKLVLEENSDFIDLNFHDDCVVVVSGINDYHIAMWQAVQRDAEYIDKDSRYARIS